MNGSEDKQTQVVASTMEVREDGSAELDAVQESPSNRPRTDEFDVRKKVKKSKSQSEKKEEVENIETKQQKELIFLKDQENEKSIAVNDSQGLTFVYGKAYLKKLEMENFIVLRKKQVSSQLPSCCFYCELCAVKMFYLRECENHIKAKNHKKMKKAKGPLISMVKEHCPSQHQLLALSQLLDTVFVEHGLSPAKDLPLRQEITKQVHEAISEKHPECSVSLYGSSLSGFGLQGCDVNLDLSIPEEVKVPSVLLSLLDLFQTIESFCDVKEDFDAKVPRILFKHVSSGLLCELSPGNYTASHTSCLLKKYAEFDPRVRPLAVGLRHWARVCSIDCQAEGGLPGYSFALMVIQFLQETEPPILPRWSPSPGAHNGEYCTEDGFQRLNNDSIGSLWLQLFKFYCLTFNIDQWVISIREPMPLTRESKRWGHRRLAIEDPISLKRNVASSLSSDKAFDYFLGCLSTSCLYFGSPAGAPQNGPAVLVKNVQSNQASLSVNKEGNQREVKQRADTGNDEDIFEIDDLDHVTKQVEHANLDDEDTGDDNDDNDDNDDVVIRDGDVVDDGSLNDRVYKDLRKTDASKDTTEVEGSKVDCKEAVPDQSDSSVENPVYKFEALLLRGRKKPVQTCCYCKQDGHIKSQCPELKKPKLRKLPEISGHFSALLDHVCITCKADFQFSKTEVEYREKVLRNLEKYIRQVYPDAKLFLFGSSKNGFGFKNSDIDICMTLDNHVREEIDFVNVITTLAKLLKKHQDCGSVLAITTAKVPIVKFYLRSCRREADISLYNTLALENTRMLATYAKLDDRLVTLGYTVKVFAKVCEIGDASKGSLSSYAYILMLLHYLQQRNVIPVLQSLYPDDQPPPEKIIDGWNCWFLDDLSKIKRVWNSKPRNSFSVGFMWLGFLRYYTEEFDFDHDVVCCRRTKKLTKFEKMWTKHVIAIEDPFNLEHNLGAGVTRKMANYILSTFVRGRERFGMPVYDNIPLELYQQYFFDVYYLTDGCEAPADRNCRVCGKIGHIAKDCPFSKANRRAEQKKEEIERQAEKETAEKSKLNSKPFNAGPTRPRSISAPNKQSQDSLGGNKGGTKPQSLLSSKEGMTEATKSTSVARSQEQARTGNSEEQPQPLAQSMPLPSHMSHTTERVDQSGQERGAVTPNSVAPGRAVQGDVPRGTDEHATQQENKFEAPIQQPHVGRTVTGKSPDRGMTATTSRPINSVHAAPVVSIPAGHTQVPPVYRNAGGVITPPGLLVQGGILQASMPGPPQPFRVNVPQSPPLNAANSSKQKTQQVVVGSPPDSPWGVSHQFVQHPGSPVQREMWLRSQHGLLMSPHSPPPRPLVPYALSPDPDQRQRPAGSAPEGALIQHGSPGREAWNHPEAHPSMIACSPPVISRSVMWSLPSNSPPQAVGTHSVLSPVRGQPQPNPCYQPQLAPGRPPGVMPTVINSSPQSVQVPTSPHSPLAQLQQPVFGAHMTGEQFINMMRAVEEASQRSGPVHRPELPSKDMEPKDTPPIPAKQLKTVAKTDEEQQLLTKLSQVRSLWEGDIVHEKNDPLPQSSNALTPENRLDEARVEPSAPNESGSTCSEENTATREEHILNLDEECEPPSETLRPVLSSESFIQNVVSVNAPDNSEPPKNVHDEVSEKPFVDTEGQVNDLDEHRTKEEQNAEIEEDGPPRPKSKRRGGRNRSNRRARQVERETASPEKLARNAPRDVKYSPQRGYNEFKEGYQKASPVAKKPKGLNTLQTQRYRDSEQSSEFERVKGNRTQKEKGRGRGSEPPSENPGYDPGNPSKGPQGKASYRERGKPRSRNKSGIHSGDQDSSRRRSNSAPQNC